ncbi:MULTISPECIES: hypothetical protein [unclassified Arcicella]|uniref:hypothetical protein n=1 Tax=unclassified Arcicella TaxID=2644986 RepID=UPI002855488D|nr:MULTISPECIES: hypothetical protein [unclassified Arcicella]MDR6563210.1 hypothetical protein [Arcicella sp. BE51]MDR6811639.1 hypothetical protein [Arcicella sp. BE140]MDR6823165.1 hypothetical protein [Arcicella sp. BE139]
MKKITLFIIILATIVSFTACEQKFGSDVTPQAPVSIVGKWSISGFGTITNIKTYEATLQEIKSTPKIDTTMVSALATGVSFDFKQDGTYAAGKTVGTWKTKDSNKTIDLITKDNTGKESVQTFSVLELTANSLKLGSKKFTKNASGNIEAGDFSDLPFMLLGSLAIGVKGSQKEFDDATFLQGTLIFKR